MIWWLVLSLVLAEGKNKDENWDSRLDERLYLRSYNFKDSRFKLKWSHNDTHIDFYARTPHRGYVALGLGHHKGMKEAELIGNLVFNTISLKTKF